jgi:hypothetical protein
MTQARLDELIAKANNKEIEINEMAQICGAILESISRHSKDIKSRLKVIEEKVSYIEERLDLIQKNTSPAFGIIIDDDEED